MTYKIDLFGVTGFILTVLGFFLIPFIIGVPIILVGWLILIISFFKNLVDLVIPKNVQTKIVEETDKSYKPYMPIIQSLLKLIWDMLKVATVVATLTIIYLAIKTAGWL